MVSRLEWTDEIMRAHDCYLEEFIPVCALQIAFIFFCCFILINLFWKIIPPQSCISFSYITAWISHNWECIYIYILPLWRRKWQPTPVFLPGESQGRRSLVGCSSRGRKESDMTEWLHFTSLLSLLSLPPMLPSTFPQSLCHHRVPFWALQVVS